MAKQLPQGKTNKNKEGRKPLADGQHKITIGVGLRQSEIDRLNEERKLQSVISGVTVEQSVFARSCIMAYLSLLDAIKDGTIAPGVLDKVRARMAKTQEAY